MLESSEGKTVSPNLRYFSVIREIHKVMSEDDYKALGEIFSLNADRVFGTDAMVFLKWYRRSARCRFIVQFGKRQTWPKAVLFIVRCIADLSVLTSIYKVNESTLDFRMKQIKAYYAMYRQNKVEQLIRVMRK